MKPKISLFIITHNEETKIADCILSAKELADEVILIDDASTDNTRQIAQELGANVYERKFDGFANQKNFALSKVTGEWALNLDADERLTPALKEEILKTLPGAVYNGYDIPFSNYFLGKKMKFSGLNKEHHLRLVRTQSAHYTGGLVHEGLHIEGEIGRLKHPINHYSYDSIETYFRKFNTYTTLAAKQMYTNGKKVPVVILPLVVAFEFFKRYVMKLGFLDGVRGFMWAAFSSFYVLVKYLKLWFIKEQSK